MDSSRHHNHHHHHHHLNHHHNHHHRHHHEHHSRKHHHHYLQHHHYLHNHHYHQHHHHHHHNTITITTIIITTITTTGIIFRCVEPLISCEENQAHSGSVKRVNGVGNVTQPIYTFNDTRMSLAFFTKKKWLDIAEEPKKRWRDTTTPSTDQRNHKPQPQSTET